MSSFYCKIIPLDDPLYSLRLNFSCCGELWSPPGIPELYGSGQKWSPSNHFPAYYISVKQYDTKCDALIDDTLFQTTL